MWIKAFWKAATERAIKSAAQAVLGLAVSDRVFNVFQFSWERAGGVALGAAILSYLSSLVSASIPGTGSGPSLTTAEGLQSLE